MMVVVVANDEAPEWCGSQVYIGNAMGAASADLGIIDSRLFDYSQ